MIRSEKNCTFKLGVGKKKFDPEGKTIAPPRIKWSALNKYSISLLKNYDSFAFLLIPSF